MLNELSDKYGKRGLVLLAFPTREFGLQEFATDQEVKAFATEHGPHDLVVLRTARLGSRTGWWQQVRPMWNFRGKWLVDKDGNRHATTTETLSSDIERLLQL